MKLKNIGNKIISIGATVILPGETKEVTGYDDNEIVKFFIGQGNLSEVKSRTAAMEKYVMEDAVRIFRLVSTEFDVLNDENVEAWLNLTAPLISKKVFGKLYDQAIALLTAHRLKMAGYGDNQYGSVGDALRVGSYTEGETSVSFNVNQGTNLMADAELALTPYGLEYLTLRRLVVISIRSAGECR